MWTVIVTKAPDLLDGRFSVKNASGQWVRNYHYKRDALQFLDELRRRHGNGRIERT